MRSRFRSQRERNRLLMLDVDTFLTTLYVTVDDFCQSRSPKRKPGPEASLSASEVITLSIFARWSRFVSERDFYRYAEANLRDAFPTCPTARSSTAVCAPAPSSSRLSPCTWRTFSQTHKSALTKPWIARRCLSGTPSVGGQDGWPGMPTSVGLTAWDGMRALACSPLQ